LDAATQLPDVRFVWCGDGAYRPTLERRAAELGVADRVIFLGKRPDVPAILTTANVVCHPSHAEGLPNALLEAAAAAKPMVATRVGGIPELVRDGESGFLVPPRDPPALTRALRVVLSNPERASAMGQAARAQVEREFTLSRMA